MKIGRETVELGMRFYTFIDDENYKILTYVGKGKFMNEETFELEEISEKDLYEYYTMLSEYNPFVVMKFKSNWVKDDNLFCNDASVAVLAEYKNWFNVAERDILEFGFKMVVYKYMRKSVFDKLINYILNLNNPSYSLSDSDSNEIWEMYFRYMSKSAFVLKVDDDKLNMDDVVNNNAKIQDSVFSEAEEFLNTYILTYEAYELDDSVDISNVNMKYFVIYNHDKYYIILYVADTTRIARQKIADMNDEIDVVRFMLG